MKTTLTKGSITITTDTFGAELRSLILDGREYLWQGDPAYWSGQAPILFPIIGTLPDGTCTSAQGPCTMGRHGIARRSEHRLIAETPDSVTYELTDSEETLKAFPFRFVLRMTYTITHNGGVETRFYVGNPGDVPLPYTLGGHPAFNVPIPMNDAEKAEYEEETDEFDEPDTFEDYELRFAQAFSCRAPLLRKDGLFDLERWVTIINDEKTLLLNHYIFREDALMLSAVPEETITLYGRKSGHGLKMDFPGFDYLGLWQAPGDTPFLAIEPWTGHSSNYGDDAVFEHKAGIRILQPGESAEYAFVIYPF